MHLARHAITPTHPVHILSTQFDAECKIFTVSTPTGWAVYRTWPLALLRKRDLPNGTLSHILPLHTTSLLFLVGGGLNPLYSPNKVILWDDSLSREIAELEFRGRVMGIACRRGWLAVALKRRVIVFEIRSASDPSGKGKESETGSIRRWKEWETYPNDKGLLAFATDPGSTLLAIPGRLKGQVQLIHLPPCPGPPPQPSSPPSSTQPLPKSHPPPTPRKPQPHYSGKHQEIVPAHESSLSTLAVTPSGSLLSTTSNRGTLIRVWDTHTAKRIREFRRGTDQAEIYGVSFRKDESELCVWSDKGTVHVFRLGEGSGSNRHSTFSPLSPYIRLPKYFSSEWSYAQYRLPSLSANITLSSTLAPSMTTPSSLPTDRRAEEEKCVVGWIEVPSEKVEAETEWQLVAITYVGGWYRLSLPSASSSAPASSPPTPEPPSSRHSSSTRTRVASSPSPFPRQLLPSSPTHTSSRLSTLAPAPSEARGTVPQPPPSIPSSSRTKGKEKERERSRERGKEKEKESSSCVLEEFRRFGRWDGWG